MENASKALLIAGAILIAILLIAIGMMVFTNANGVIETATTNMSTQEKTAFNKQFDVYSGRQSGSVVNELVTLITTNNSNTENITITLTKPETIQRQKQYDITFGYSDGVINSCTITVVGS